VRPTAQDLEPAVDMYFSCVKIPTDKFEAYEEQATHQSDSGGVMARRNMFGEFRNRLVVVMESETSSIFQL
jgi:hypothetical protein